MMVWRVTNLMCPRIRGVCQWRCVLMMRRRCMSMMMMGRRVYVTVPVAHRMMVGTGCTVHIVQKIVVGRQCIVLEIQDIR